MVSVQQRYERLLRTIQFGSIQEVKVLFTSSGYDINQEVEYLFEDRKKYTVTPLYWAVRYHRTQVCRYLLEKGARPYSHMVYEYYPLHEACNKGYEDIVQEFVNIQCDLDRTTNDLDTPLHIACMRGHIPCVHMLLRANADRNKKNKDGHTPLQAALYHGHHDLFDLFKAYKDDGQVTLPCPNTVGLPTTCAITTSSSSNSGAKIQRSNSMCDHTSALSQSHRRAVHNIKHSSSHVKKARPMSVTINSDLLPDHGQNFREWPQSFQTEPSSLAFSSIATTTTSSPHCRPVNAQNCIHAHTTSPSVVNPTSKNRPVVHNNLSLIHTLDTADSPSPVERDGVTLANSTSTSVSTTTACNLSKQNDALRDFSTCSVSRTTQSYPYLQQDRHSNLHKQSSEPLPQISGRRGSQRSDKAFYESASNPEFALSRLCDADRYERSDETLPVKIMQSNPSSKLALISPSRERIDTLSKHFVSSVSPELLSNYPHWDPITKGIKKIVNNMAPLFNITEDNLRALTNLVSLVDLAESTSAFSDHLSTSEIVPPSFDYEHSDTPLAVKLDVPAKGYITLLFEASLKHNTHSIGESVLLKVVTKIFNLKDQEDSSRYHQLCLSDTPSSPNTFDDGTVDCLNDPVQNEASSLEKLTSCSSIGRLISHFQADTDRYSVFAKQFSPDDPSKMYTTAKSGDFFLLGVSGVTLDKYFEKQFRNSLNFEEDVLIILIQLFLAVAHLNVKGIVHCAVLAENIYVEKCDQNSSIHLTNFSHAIQLNAQTSEVISATEKVLKSQINHCNGLRCCALPPEVVDCVQASKLETKHIHGELIELFHKADSFAAAKLIYELLLGQNHEFLQENCTTSVPNLRMLSSNLNRLLRDLVAIDPSERLSAIDGVLCCMVLLFGPSVTELSTPQDSQRWILAEAMEFYMRPVLRDCNGMSSEYADMKSKLLCMYLAIGDADPARVFKASNFFME